MVIIIIYIYLFLRGCAEDNKPEQRQRQTERKNSACLFLCLELVKFVNKTK